MRSPALQRLLVVFWVVLVMNFVAEPVATYCVSEPASFTSGGVLQTSPALRPEDEKYLVPTAAVPSGQKT